MEDTENIESVTDTNTIADTPDSYRCEAQELLIAGDTNKLDVYNDRVDSEMEQECTINTSVVIVEQMNNDDYLSVFRVYKNLTSVGVSFTLLFTAFISLASLQSTINQSGGIGTLCLAIIYVCMVIVGLFLPTLTISKLGSKWTMAIAMATYLGYIAADFQASWATKLPTSVLLGIGAAHLWTAQTVFVAELAKRHAVTTKQQQDHVTSKLFGIFYALYISGIVWGNLISSLVLRQSSTTDDPDNSSLLASWELCGADFCSMSETTNLFPPDSDKLHTYIGLCIGCGVVAVIITTTLDNIRTPQPPGDPRTMVSGIVRHVWNSTNQKLLIPCTIYRGLSIAFIQGELTAAFTSCMFGVQNVGLVMICVGSTSAMFAFVFGQLSKYSGHFILFATAYTIQLAVSLMLLLYPFDGGKLYVVFILAALRCVGDAVLQPTIPALYSRFFKNSTDAFACFRVFDSTGSAISFAYSAALCTSPKIYILIAVLVLSICCLAILEILDRRDKHKTLQK